MNNQAVEILTNTIKKNLHGDKTSVGVVGGYLENGWTDEEFEFYLPKLDFIISSVKMPEAQMDDEFLEATTTFQKSMDLMYWYELKIDVDKFNRFNPLKFELAESSFDDGGGDNSKIKYLNKEIDVLPWSGEYYFCKAVFDSPVGKWLNDGDVCAEIDRGLKGKEMTKTVYDTYRRVNEKSKEVFGKELFVWGRKNLKRIY